MDQDVLLTFAEVGIAIAGFSGIVVSLGKRAHGRWDDKDRFRLRDLLFTSVGVGIFGFLPIVLKGTGMADQVTFQYSSAVLFLYILTGVMAFLRVGTGKLGLASWVMAVPTLLLAAMLALVAANVIFRVAVFTYYLTLFWMVLLSVANFSRLLLEGDHQEAEEESE